MCSSFIDAAKQESIDTILDLADYKDPSKEWEALGGRLYGQRMPMSRDLPEADLIIGTGEYNKIVPLLVAFERKLRRNHI